MQGNTQHCSQPRAEQAASPGSPGGHQPHPTAAAKFSLHFFGQSFALLSFSS